MSIFYWIQKHSPKKKKCICLFCLSLSLRQKKNLSLPLSLFSLFDAKIPKFIVFQFGEKISGSLIDEPEKEGGSGGDQRRKVVRVEKEGGSLGNFGAQFAFAVHASFLASGFDLTATGRPAFANDALSSSPTQEVGIDGWN